MGEAVGSGRVALVIQRRIADEGFAAFARWNARVAERLRARPGFLRQEVVPPSPPTQVDWVVVLRFVSAEAARDWIESAERADLLREIARYFVGPEDLHLLPDTGSPHETAVSVVLTYTVDPADEAAFLAWQQRIQAAEAGFHGFLRHKIERPIPGLHEDWVVIVSYASDADLDRWFASSVRRAVIAEGERFLRRMRARRMNYGFSFWFQDGASPVPPRLRIFKNNLLVLLVLYPIVSFWTFVLAPPLLEAHGTPPWLVLFVGDALVTQLLGWFVVPAVSRAFAWWLGPRIGNRREAAGFALVATGYLASMAIFTAYLASKGASG
jgi:antibiotic biosynthesis monooxygenase (ABM) superfamily enzyme